MDDQEIYEIIAHEAKITVTDELTGRMFERTIPMDYYENANFMKLSGENFDGSISTLVFLSARGAERVDDLTGKGPDADPCGTHK